MTDHYSPKTSATHVASVAPWLSAETFQEALTDVHDRGYVIIEDVLSPSDCDDYRQILEQFMAVSPAGRNVFEGTSSHRLYALLAKSERFADMIEHPLALAFAEHFLGESCLLSACLSINLHPGETVQPWHTDDGHISVPQPHDVFGISVFWALDDTTETNGATEVLPYSHQWESPDIAGRLEDEHFEQRSALSEHPEAGIDRIKATMKAGSLMIMRSDVWHRGGANQTNTDRLIVTPQYCAGWARPLETMLLAVPPETVARLPSRTQALLGYSIHTPFMGYVDGMHPSRVLQ
ncbi:MAG: phytanoyl-CoA dioxygenase family protein [Luminiphilus sp.]|jgi:ectoine hydroxylase-related dioxygenase (phytanoyl-CoA dioxygenase family)|tara:strand:- start:591 stop:1469 length:879 start_codon:yes stop_codon:yes gene_type:complete